VKFGKIIIYEHSHDDPSGHGMCVPRKIEYGVSQADSLLVVLEFDNNMKSLDVTSTKVTCDENDVPFGETVDVWSGQLFTIKYEDETYRLMVGSDNPRDSTIFTSPPAIYNTTSHSSDKCIHWFNQRNKAFI
jgi:hypothetical protein